MPSSSRLLHVWATWIRSASFRGWAMRDLDPVVALHPPAVDRVGLADIDHHERGAVLVAAIELLDVARLAAERAAGEVAEDQDDRLGPDELRERDRPALPSTVLSVKSGAGRPDRRAGLERADLLAEEPLDQREPARALRAARIRGPATAASGPPGGRPARGTPRRRNRPRGRRPRAPRGSPCRCRRDRPCRIPSRPAKGQRVRREVEVASGEHAVAVAVEPGEVGVGAGELAPPDLAVAVAVEPRGRRLQS